MHALSALKRFMLGVQRALVSDAVDKMCYACMTFIVTVQTAIDTLCIY